MNKSPIPSRNKLSNHSYYTICPQCGKRVYYDGLKSSLGQINYFSKNTLIVTCYECDTEFLPDVSHYFDYIYSGACSTKDKRVKE